MCTPHPTPTTQQNNHPHVTCTQVRNAATRAVQATPQTLRNFYVVVKRHEEKLALLLEFLKVRFFAWLYIHWWDDPPSSHLTLLIPEPKIHDSGTKGRR